MRGFFLSLLYYTVALVVLLALSYLLSSFEILPHPGAKKVFQITGYSAGVSLRGYNAPCYIDQPTFGDLSELEYPEVKPC